MPLARPLICKGNGIDGEASIADGLAATQEALDFVAGRCAQGAYLAGGRFSLADLAAASTLAVAIDPAGSPMCRPRPHSPEFAAFVARFASHPGAQWVRDIYARHRAAASDFEGRSSY